MRVLVTGGDGMLARTLASLVPDGMELHLTARRRADGGPRRHLVDLADPARVREVWARVRPDVVVHTAYDKADGPIGILGLTRHVAETTAGARAGLVHVSSDVVFDGERSPYAETDPPRPVSTYGRWKAGAEHAVGELHPAAAVVRCSLVVSRFGDPAGDHLDRLLPGDPRDGLFVDELRQPIGAVDLARQLWELAALPDSRRSGTWHLAGPEVLSRYALGLLVTSFRGDPARPPARRDDHPGVRPRELHLSADRAARTLVTRARPVSELLARHENAAGR